MKQGGLFKLSGYLLSAICLLSGCSIIDEDKCVLNYIEYRYLNNVGEDASSLYLNEVTDFIFTKDSVLYRVDEQIPVDVSLNVLSIFLTVIGLCIAMPT